jgi:succinate-semialdehyde dehydrogenase/glutarate-semialdehyde dehydrogenase
MAIESINPANGKLLRTYDEMSASDVDAIIERAHRAHLDWRDSAFSDRSALMRRAAQVLRDDSASYARLMTEEMGKPIKDGRGEVEKCAWACDFYAEMAEEFLKPIPVATDASKSFVAFEPLGVVLAVMPWNFPFWQVFRFAAPALMAGNAGVLKHASNVMGSALAIEEVFQKAGFPHDLFRSLLIGGRQVARVIENPRVMAVTLTGSTPAGKAVASKAGEMLKKTVLELGGSDPYVILGDADLEEAADICVRSRLINSGQSCIAAKRFIVLEKQAPAFEKRFVELMKTKKMGDPMEEDTVVGPQAREDLRDELHEQVRKSVEKGARLLLGGEVPKAPGAFYPPTVLAGVKKGMPAYDEELFGPVAAIIAVADEDDAVRVANDSVFGLGAAVFTKDTRRGEEIARKHLQAGACFVNTFVKSDPRLPFGGIKESGYGRELADFGIREFVNIKTVYVK